MEKKNKFKASVILPIFLFIYLGVMAYIGLPWFEAGEYLTYFGTIGVCLVVIVLLAFVLRKKEAYRERRRREAEAWKEED